MQAKTVDFVPDYRLDPDIETLINLIIENRKKNAHPKTIEQLEAIKSNILDEWNRNEPIDARNVVEQINKLTIKLEAL